MDTQQPPPINSRYTLDPNRVPTYPKNPRCTSTVTTPPKVIIPNIKEVCDKKKELVKSLPTSCNYCKKPFKEGAIIERKEGTIVAYCKEPDCCLSSELFTMPNLSIPKYKQVCMWEEDLSTSSATEQQRGIMLMHGFVSSGNGLWTPLATSKDSKCKKCHKTLNEHELPYDENGWYQCATEVITVPTDWPTWNPQTKSWHIPQ